MTGRPRRLRQRLVVSAYTAGWAVVRWLPGPLVSPLCRLLAAIVWRRRGRGVVQLETNLRRVLHAGLAAAATGGADRVAPDAGHAVEQRVAALSRAGLRSYCRYWMEVFRLPAMSREHIFQRFTVYGAELLWKALESGRGVVLALPHSGNWDHAGAWIAMSGYPFTTVAERLRPDALYRRFVGFRERLGMEVLPLTGGADDVYGALADRLRGGGVVCLLADRDLSGSGVEVSFFGESARMPAGPAALALDTGAALVPVTLWYEGKGWAGRAHNEVTVPSNAVSVTAGSARRRAHIATMTRQMAAAFEESIAAHPHDWHMLQRLWVTDLGGSHR